MIPLSTVDNPAWKEWLAYIDPSYRVPTVETVKLSGLFPMVKRVEVKVKDLLMQIKYVNVSVDGWTDKTNRSFNGYIAQGIDSDWVMRTVPVAFKLVKGRHTGNSIKAQFDEVCKDLGIENKVFKIVADQGEFKNFFQLIYSFDLSFYLMHLSLIIQDQMLKRLSKTPQRF